MKISGANDVAHPPQVVWDAILDPRVLVAAIPGCSRLESTGEHAYDMTVTAGVAAIKGTYDGACALSDLAPRESLTMRLNGAGAPGTVDATVAVRFEDLGGSTRIAYDADATVGGMVGGVGQRMLSSVSKRMAGEFFGNVAKAIENPPSDVVERQVVEQVGEVVEQGGRPATDRVETAAGVFTPPGRQASSQSDFLRGVAVGAGLVTLGVIIGGVFGRRA